MPSQKKQKINLRFTCLILLSATLVNYTYAARGDECQEGCNHCNVWRTKCFECVPGWGRREINSETCEPCKIIGCGDCFEETDVCLQCQPGHFTSLDSASTTEINNCILCDDENCEDCNQGTGVCSSCKSGYKFNDAKICVTSFDKYLLAILVIVALVLIICCFCFMSSTQKATACNILGACNEMNEDGFCCCVACDTCSCVATLCSSCNFSDACSKCETIDGACCIAVCKGVGSCLEVGCSVCSVCGELLK